MKSTALSLAALAAMLILPMPTEAQQMRRCYINGQVVIQEDRCPDKPTVPTETVTRYDVPRAGETTAPAPSYAGPIEAGKALCRAAAPKAVTWKDPGSLIVGEPFGGKMQVTQLHGVAVPSRLFFVPVNGKNSYGGYAGEKSLMCYTSQDGTRILKVDNLLL